MPIHQILPPAPLQNEISFQEFNAWRANVISYAKENEDWKHFLPRGEYSTWTALAEAEDEQRITQLSAADKKIQAKIRNLKELKNKQLSEFIEFVCKLASPLEQQSIRTTSTSFNVIMQFLQESRNIDRKPKNILQLRCIKYTENEDFNEFYYRFRSVVCDNLKKKGDTFEDIILQEDEIISPTFEEVIVLWCLERIDAGLPNQVFEQFGMHLVQGSSLKELQEEIFEFIPNLLEASETKHRTHAMIKREMENEVNHKNVRPVDYLEAEMDFEDDENILKSIEADDPYKCPVTECNKTCATEAGMIKHISWSHDPEGDAEYHISDEMIQAWEEKKSIKCPRDDCDKMLLSQRGMSEHMRVHKRVKEVNKHVSNIWKCPKCTNEFQMRENLIHHLADDHDIIMTADNEIPGELSCEICKIKCSGPMAMFCHQRRHRKTDPFRFECSTCNENFGSQAARKRHRQNVHPDEDPNDVTQELPSMECTNCRVVFKTLKMYKRHTKAACMFCNQKFVCRDLCDEHTKMHNPQTTNDVSMSEFMSDESDSEVPNKTKKKSNKPKDEFECPEPGCNKVCTSKQGLSSHLTLKHHIDQTSILDGPLTKDFLKCPVCPKLCSSQEWLDKHIDTVHDGKTDFKSRMKTKEEIDIEYTMKLIGSGANVSMKCPMSNCDKECNTQQGLTSHLKFHKRVEQMERQNKNIWKCHNCSEEHETREELVNHMIEVHEAAPDAIVIPGEAQCKNSDCNELFSSAGALKFHIKKAHSQTNPDLFICSTCGESFTTHENRKKHRKSAHPQEDPEDAPTGRTKFICSTCNAVFTKSSGRKLHRKTCHPDEDPDDFDYECHQCNKKFDKKEDRDEHIKIHIEAQKKGTKIAFICSTCGDSFTTHGSRKRHRVTLHPTEDPEDSGSNQPKFRCAACGAQLKTPTSLSLHKKKSHPGLSEEDYAMMEEYSILEEQEKQAHDNGEGMMDESGDMEIEDDGDDEETPESRRFVCFTCGQSFTKISKRTEHRRSFHPDEDPNQPTVQCLVPNCRKRYDDQKQLEEHNKIHIAENHKKPYACILCGPDLSGFISKDNLAYHMNRFHPDRHIDSGEKILDYLLVKNYCCNVCQFKCVTEDEVKVHYAQNHQRAATTKQEVIIGSMDVNVNVHPTTSATGFGNEDNITNEILKQAFGTDTFDNTMGGQPEPQNWRRLINPRDFVACPICTEVITWMMFTSHVDKHEKDKELSMSPMKCQMCHADFENERALMDHILLMTHIDVTPKEDGPDKAPVIPILCPICPKKLANKTLFMGHMHRHRVMETRLASGIWKCTWCAEECTSKQNLLLHVQRKHRNDDIDVPKGLRCHHCGLDKFDSKTSLREHVYFHHSPQIPNPIGTKCFRCNIEFSNPYHLMLHMRDDFHPDDKELEDRFTCFICYRMDFKSSEGVKQHMLTFHRENKQGEPELLPMLENKSNHSYTCEVCGKSFQTVTNLSAHKKCHEDKVLCTLCGKSYRSNFMARHMQMHEQGTLCEICNRGFKDKGEFEKHECKANRHSRLKWPKGHVNRDLYCSTCNRHFRNKYHIANHICKHHKCDLCEAAFCRIVNLNKHKLIHQGIPMLHCDFEGCEALYKNKKRLSEHKSEVHNPVRKQCPECELTFTCTSNLNKHVRRQHGKEKNVRYECQVCGNLLKTSFALKLHLERHNKNRPKFECIGNCGKLFNSVHYRNRHYEVMKCGQQQAFPKMELE